MIPFTAQNIPWYAGIAISSALLWSLIAYFERRESRRRSEFIRSKLTAERCLLCGSPFNAWDGQLFPVDNDSDSPPWSATLEVVCSGCQSKCVFCFYDRDDECDCLLVRDA